MTAHNQELCVIGLGAMGSALARALLASGAQVSVWNRSPEKAAPLGAAGAKICATPAEALRDCQTAVVCLSGYDAWATLCADRETATTLRGKTVLQLTTGTLADVDAHLAHMTELGVQVIEGAILGSPEQIGTPGASMITAGDADLVVGLDALLAALSPNVTYLGASHGAPVVLSRAAISSVLGFLVGTINGAAMCQAGGVPLSAFRAQLENRAAQLRTEPLRLIDAIASGETAQTQASLGTWGDGQAALLSVAHALGLDTSFQDGLRAVFDKAQDLGLGSQDLSALAQAFHPDQSD